MFIVAAVKTSFFFQASQTTPTIEQSDRITIMQTRLGPIQINTKDELILPHRFLDTVLATASNHGSSEVNGKYQEVLEKMH